MNKFLNFAGKYKFLSHASCLLSGLSALIAVLPLWFIWNIAVSVLFSENTEYITHYAWQAVIYAVISMFVYIAGLLCSHMAAFRIAQNIHVSSGVLSVPLNYVARVMPDSYFSLFSSVGLIALLFWADWKLALAGIASIILGFIIMAMTGSSELIKKTEEYHKAMKVMSNETGEYVKGVSGGQGKFSFRRFADAVMNYGSCAEACAVERRVPMICYTVAVNSSFLFLIAAGIGISRSGISQEFLKNFLLAVIAAPLISVKFTRTMRLRESHMNALAHINRILNQDTTKGRI